MAFAKSTRRKVPMPPLWKAVWKVETEKREEQKKGNVDTVIVVNLFRTLLHETKLGFRALSSFLFTRNTYPDPFEESAFHIPWFDQTLRSSSNNLVS